VGNLVTLPLLFPYEAWKSLENSGKFSLIPSVKSWWNSNIRLIKEAYQSRKLRWIASVSYFYVAAVLSFSGLVYFFGIWGLCKYWFFPWVVHHFLMSTFISMSYQLPKSDDTGATIVIHFKYPAWVEFITNNINYLMTSQYLSTLIPNHNIRESYSALRLSAHRSKLIEGLLFIFQEESAGTALRKKIVESQILHRINWPTVIFLTSIHVLSIYGIFTTELKIPTLMVGIFTYFFGGLGITAGYHRYWAHRSYEASWPAKILLLIMGTSAMEGSVIWWARDHRAHHRFSDTDKDPYGVNNGLLWAHLGWMVVKKDKKKIGKTDISDLTSDPLLKWQDKNYRWFALLIGIVLPTVICGVLFDDWRGGYFYASVLRAALVLEGTWCINSLAHYMGDATYSDQRSPRDSWIVSLITFGEGYHCFHHEFPYDYRNGVKYRSYDPTKWLIFFWNVFGLTFNLKRFPANEIEKGAYLMAQKKLEEKKAQLKWGPKIEDLPVFTMDQVKEDTDKGASLVVIKGIVHDVTDFITQHPGGQAFIKTKLGKDATQAFTGGVYNHSLAAWNVLEVLRVGRVEE
jgi:stearoyl-CoA desaturase (delta-9 desaturase)